MLLLIILIDFLVDLVNVVFLLLLLVAGLLVVDRLVVLHVWAAHEVADLAFFLLGLQLMLLDLNFFAVLLVGFRAGVFNFLLLDLICVLVNIALVLSLLYNLLTFLLHLFVEGRLVVLVAVDAVVHLVQVLLWSFHSRQVLLLILICFVLLHLLLMRIEIVQNGLWVAINLILHSLKGCNDITSNNFRIALSCLLKSLLIIQIYQLSS